MFLGRQLVAVELSAAGPKSPFAQLVSMTAMQRLLALMPVSSAFDHGRNQSSEHQGSTQPSDGSSRR